MNGNEEDDGIVIENDAVLTIVEDGLVVLFGQDRNILMELDTESEVELCQQVLADPNFWLNFTQSLSGALKKQLAH